jgi:hypothetical protein
MMTCFTLLGSLLLFAVNTVAYMCGPITAAKVLRDDRFRPLTPAEAAERLTSQQSKVLASASSDILVYVDYGTIVVQRGAIVSNLFELRGDYEVVFLSDLKLGVIVIDTRLEFLRFDSEFRNVRTFACDLPPSSWQYGRQLFLGGGERCARQHGFCIGGS